MNRFPKLLIAAAVTVSVAAGSAAGQSRTPWSEGLSRPEDLRIQLVTILPGDELYTWWGHSGIIVEDTQADFSRFYNYGLFSFDEDNFFADFARGRLVFEVGATPTLPSLRYYQSVDRTIIIQTLDLSPIKRLALARFVDDNVLPQNRRYLYDHYEDNCATRVRDIINRYLGGGLRAQTAIPAGSTYRKETRRYTAHNFPVDFVLMYLMGPSIDRPITEWETMFLPDKLERYVAQAQVIDEAGDGRPLVNETTLYYQAKERRVTPESAPPLWPPSLAVGLTIGLLGVGSAFASRRTGGLGIAGRIAYGTVITLFGLSFGIMGTVLFFMSIFTDHAVTYGNENLFFSNPITLALVPIGIMLASTRRPEKRRWRLVAARIVLGIHVAGGIIVLVLKAAGVMVQRNWPALALVLAAVLPLLAAIVPTEPRTADNTD